MGLFERALPLLKDEELQHILSSLIRCNSENPGVYEESVAAEIAAILENEGIDSERMEAAPGRPNIMAMLQGAQPGKTVIWNGHLDVVPAGANWTRPPFAAVFESPLMYGRGAADMKGGLAAVMYAVIVLKRMGCPFRGNIIVYFNVDEERENLGMRAFIDSAVTADYAVVCEPTELDLCVGHKGVNRLRLSTFGRAGHASEVRADNAVYHMGKVIGALEEWSGDLSLQRHAFIGNPTLAITQIEGGTAPNIIPEQCTIEIDRRTIPGERSEDIQQEVMNRIQRLADQHGFRWELESYLYIPAGYIDPQLPLVQLLSQSIEKVTGDVMIRAFEATCEASFFTICKGIPTVIFGPGSLKQAHVADEFVSMDEVKAACLTLIDLADRLL